MAGRSQDKHPTPEHALDLLALTQGFGNEPETIGDGLQGAFPHSLLRNNLQNLKKELDP